jgi:hypothetical protein
MIGVIKLLCALLMCSHFFGCGIFLIGNARHLSGSRDNWLDSGVSINGVAVSIVSNVTLGGLDGAAVAAAGYVASAGDITRWYSYSVYWAMALLTTGWTNVRVTSQSELVFGCFVLVVGALMYTVIITNLQDIVAQSEVTVSLYRAKINKAQQYCIRQYLPEVFGRRKNDSVP